MTDNSPCTDKKPEHDRQFHHTQTKTGHDRQFTMHRQKNRTKDRQSTMNRQKNRTKDRKTLNEKYETIDNNENVFCQKSGIPKMI